MYLVVDTETTGLDHKKHSILEIGIVVTDDHFTPVAQYSSTVLPIGQIDPKALAVNKIDIRDIQKPRQQVVEEVIAFIAKHCPEKPGLLGHNILFDLPFIDQLYEKHPYNRFSNTYDYRRVHDVKCIANFLQECGVIEVARTSLDALVDELLPDELEIKKKPGHHALWDCFRTLMVFVHLKNLVSKTQTLIYERDILDMD